MLKKILKQIFTSVFHRLFAVLILTGALIISLVMYFFVLFHEIKYHDALIENVSKYAMYLLNDLGSPPDFETAKKLSVQLSLFIRYESGDKAWTTYEYMPTYKQLKPYMKYSFLFSKPDRETEIWHIDADLDDIMKIERGPDQDIILIKRKNDILILTIGEKYQVHEKIHKLIVAPLVILLTIIMISVYFIVRKILYPIKPLSEGVRQLGKGNLEHRVMIKRSDELGEMAEAFNEMADRIKKMLKAREQLLLDVSHELRSPLTRMKVAMEFMPDNEIKHNIKDDVSEMEIMITEILETARLQHKHGQLNIKQVNIADLVQDTVKVFSDSPLEVKIKGSSSNLITDIDTEQIKTVLKNIITNAIKYSSGTSIPIKINIENQKQYIVVKITDNGIGIPRDELPYIFEPFYRVDKSRSKKTGGFGLGLNLCKTIMEAHKGKIKIKSTPETGTDVYLYFNNSTEKGNNR